MGIPLRELRERRGNPRVNPLARDLNHILSRTECLWEELRGKRLFITGGTGFFGCWLLESFAWANDRLGLDASILVLTRSYEAFQTFRKKAPHLAANPAIRFHFGDVRNFEFPEEPFSHIIHAAATPAVATFHNVDPLVTFDIVLEGTRRALDFAVKCNARKFLLISSGSVYGKQPSGIPHISEDYGSAPDPSSPGSALGVAKRAAECLGALYSRTYGMEPKIARCFSFVGPYLPLDIQYAIGNFMRDALNGGPILVKGDGTPYRSYLYTADLAVWLWTIFFKGEPYRAYNVGSEEELTIADLARTVARSLPDPVEVNIAGAPALNTSPERYVPSTKRAQKELGVEQVIDLSEAIERTLSHVRAHRHLYFPATIERSQILCKKRL